MNAFSCIFSHSIGNKGNNNSTYFSLVILSLRSKCITITSQGGKCEKPTFFQIRELVSYSGESKIRDFPGNIFRNNNLTYFSLFILVPQVKIHQYYILPRVANAPLLGDAHIFFQILDSRESKVEDFLGYSRETSL